MLWCLWKANQVENGMGFLQLVYLFCYLHAPYSQLITDSSKQQHVGPEKATIIDFALCSTSAN